MRTFSTMFAFGLVAASVSLAAVASPRPAPLIRFEGAIGVDPLTAAGGVDTSNVVRGISPGGRAWVLRRLQATVGADGSIFAKGSGLLFASGDLIGTRGTVSQVAVTLFCGAANAAATSFSSTGAALDAAGNFRIQGVLSQDGVNTAVMPATCDNPVLLVRSANVATGALGGWFGAGIPAGGDDD